MRTKIFMLVFNFVALNAFLFATINLKKTNEWRHENSEIFGYTVFSLIDRDNEIVGGFFKIGCRLITPQKIIEFAPRGEGPSDLTNFFAIINYKDDIGIVERPDKIKIFEKKSGIYKWKKTLWLKRSPFAHIVRNSLFYDDKIFLAGFEFIGSNNKNRFETYLLKVYDENGQPLKQLLKQTYGKFNQYYVMMYYMVGYKDKLFFMTENDLSVSIISTRNLNFLEKAKLEVPAFYKNMPPDFYNFKKYSTPDENFERDIETWAKSYSRITKIALDKNYLVIQIRVFDNSKKKFALLFYDIEDHFKLKKTAFIDSFLLGVKEGNYYFYAKGDPGYDEEADECTIEIFKFGGEK